MAEENGKTSIETFTRVVTAKYLHRWILDQGLHWEPPEDLQILVEGSQSTLASLDELSIQLLEMQGNAVETVASQIDESNAKCAQSLDAVAKELFSHGFKWSHVVVLMLFSRDVAVRYGANDPSIFDFINEWLSSFLLKESTRNMIDSAGGWSSLSTSVSPRIPSPSVSAQHSLMVISSFAFSAISSFFRF